MWKLVEYKKSLDKTHYFKILAHTSEVVIEPEFFDTLKDVVCEITVDNIRFEVFIKQLILTELNTSDGSVEIEGISLEEPILKREIKLRNGKKFLIEEKIYNEIKNKVKNIDNEELLKYYIAYKL